ncbi:hypothetical protein [Nitrosophilus alvini]|uniref:hypothetical protein n=1 Tax=Nitrosophilus alvini TaxID=2714855 RepID=UPI00190A9FBF|nr:hypothetical protein [Nitrosophilus alvini]
MKKITFALMFLSVFLSAADCKCDLNKSELRCNYYVVKKGDTTKQKFCGEYAAYLEKTEVYGKASWYYLVGGEPEKAIETGTKALKSGEHYAAEYIADAYLIEGDVDKAKKYYSHFAKNVSQRNFFINRNFAILERIYKKFDAKLARELIGN